MRILRDLRRGEFDVLVGVNLLREGLDLPEVSLVAILDADKEGFLRSKDALIQTIGRSARHVLGTAILYADRITDSIRGAMDETSRRRAKQLAWNEENGITPESIVKSLSEVLGSVWEADYLKVPEPFALAESIEEYGSPEALRKAIARYEKDMKKAAASLDFEKAAELRDRVRSLRQADLLRPE